MLHLKKYYLGRVNDLVGYSKEQQVGKRFKPKMGDRTKISPKEAERAKSKFGSYCHFCGKRDIQLHHIIYAKQLGKGKWRNLLPVCLEHHTAIHESPRIGNRIKEQRKHDFGNHYWCDEWDLWEEGLIENPTVKEFEKYMQFQELPF